MEFQQIVDGLQQTNNETERMELYMQLSQLAQDFVYVAKTYGKVTLFLQCLISHF